MKRRDLVAVTIAAALAAAVAGSCARHRADRNVTVSVRIPSGVTVDPKDIAFDPPRAVASARLWDDGWLTMLAAGGERLTVRIPGACPVTLTAAPGVSIEAKPWIDLGGDRPPLGFDAPVTIDVAPGCAEAERGHVTWRQIEGPPLSDLQVSDDGLHVRARTPTLAALHPAPLPRGIVPISPRTQGKAVLEAVWSAPGAAPVTRTVTLTSAARATGVPSLAVTQPVVLGGAGWHVRGSPRNGRAQVQAAGGTSVFTPDAAGQWLLEDEDGHALRLRAATYDKTPFDCGRAECHAAAAAAARTTPMTLALERHLDASARAPVACMLDCHVAGQRGLHDGGFLDTAAAMGFGALERAGWQDLPRSLHRVGTVGCMSCHGPGAIPESGAREAILRADVCATCHDAPPAYVHVEEWRASRMARADATARTRSDACARCHTTRGFLAAAGIHKLASPADDAEPTGIACAACHAPHGAHRGDALVRTRALPEPLRAAAERHPESAICVDCHSPAPDEPLPSASAAAILSGIAPVERAIHASAAAPHADVRGGCIGCHGGPVADAVANGSAAGSRHVDHAFRVSMRACAPCHAKGAPEEVPDARGRRVRDWALALWADLARSASPLPHAGTESPPHAAPALARATYEIALVLEDPAAGVHNAPFARELLADAEAILKKNGR